MLTYTLQALTPLFTVLSFHFLFHIHYSFMTYLSLLPLTLGVMMACTSLSFSANDLVGLSSALASTLIFVAQSIYSKNLIGRADNSKESRHEREGKLDKVNILYYSSASSVFLMIPMALYYDGTALLFGRSSSPPLPLGVPPASLSYIVALIAANGVVQFFQTFLAFSVLMLVSPITYSIASLFKRVFVICVAIVWFGQSVSGLQWLGIVLTFVGLYLYNDNKAIKSIEKGENKLREEAKDKGMSLPTTTNFTSKANMPTSPISSTTSSMIKTASDVYNQIRGTASKPVTTARTGLGIRTANDASGGGFRDYSQVDVLTSPTSSRRISRRMNPEQQVVEMASPFYPAKDPRQALPSPPPSRGSSSDEEGNIHSPLSSLLQPHSSIKHD
jgi:solute carrier family 35 protein E1